MKSEYKLFLLILVFSVSLFSVEMQKLEKPNDVSVNNEKITTVKYHNGLEEFHLTNIESKWAVRFDFNNFYSDSLSFNLESVNLYIPDVVTDTLSISIAKEDVYQPGEIIADLGQFQVETDDWNNFSIPNDTQGIDSLDVVWVLIDYDTNTYNDFMAASSGTGQHSYFQNTQGYYSDFSSSNMECELLVEARGYFNFTNYDYELVSAEYEVENNFLQPKKIEIMNNSENSVENLVLEVKYESANTEFSDTLSYEFPDGLNGLDDTIVIDESNCPEELKIDISGEDYSQYKLNYSLFVEGDTLDFNENNEKEQEVEDFAIENDKIFVENFLEYMENVNSDIWDLEEDWQDEIFVLNNFPSSADEPYFSGSSFRLFSYYGLFDYPNVILNGTKKVKNFEDSTAFVNAINSDFTTFFTSDVTNYEYDAYGNYSFDLNLTNQETHVYDSFVADLEVRVAFVDSLPEDQSIEGNCLIALISNWEDIAIDSLGFNQEITKEINFNFEEFDPISTEDEEYKKNNCSVVYWIQNSETKQIFDFNYLSFSDFVYTSTDDEINIPPSISVYPNPSYENSLVNIEMKSNTRNSDSINSAKIYNLKGQLIYSRDIKNPNEKISWNKKNNNGDFVNSGIYFLQIESNSEKYMRKILIIK